MNALTKFFVFVLLGFLFGVGLDAIENMVTGNPPPVNSAITEASILGVFIASFVGSIIGALGGAAVLLELDFALKRSEGPGERYFITFASVVGLLCALGFALPGKGVHWALAVALATSAIAMTTWGYILAHRAARAVRDHST